MKKKIILLKGASDKEVNDLKSQIVKNEFTIIGGDRELEVYEIEEDSLYRIVPSKVYIQKLEIEGTK